MRNVTAADMLIGAIIDARSAWGLRRPAQVLREYRRKLGSDERLKAAEERRKQKGDRLRRIAQAGGIRQG